VLRAASKQAHNHRLSTLAAKVAAMSGGHFDEVITAIDDMIDTLKKEEESDIETKETCEKDRMTDARTAAKTSRTIDEESEAIFRLEAEIATIKQTIAENEDKIASIKKELKEATKNRKEENEEWQQSDADDEAAAKLVVMAKGVLESFYKDSGLMLVQKAKRQPQVVAGEAPPPPPQTWDAPYGGATGESQGIISILGMIEEDILKDKEKAKKEEEEALEEFKEFKAKSEAEMKDISDENDTLAGEQGDKESAVKDNKLDRKTLKGELDAVMEKMEGALPSCNFMTINFPMRMKNRQTEIDGLDKAKGILKGAAFGL
jgi:chromosome segregation ATPase